jgi:glycosyltransferase involved in cell wall biosynthesis
MPVAVINSQATADLFRALQSAEPFDRLLVHYVGYGYARRGTPFWIVKGVKAWLRDAGPFSERRPQALTMFHELWASGPPWQTAFYLGRFQRWIARSLFALSAHSVTSTLRMQRLLEEGGRKKAIVIPVPSNISSSFAASPPSRRRLKRVLVFGQLGSRVATIKLHRRLLQDLQRREHLEKLVIAGSGARAGANESEDVAVAATFLPRDKFEVAGNLSTVVIAAQYANADCFLSYLPGSLICKATTIMAAFASGCPVVLVDGSDATPLEAGRHFTVCDGSEVSVDQLLSGAEAGQMDRVAKDARRWYEENACWDVVGKRFCEILTAAPVPDNVECGNRQLQRGMTAL